MHIKDTIRLNLSNLIGKSIKEKLIIIESDDWGSIRMPSIAARDKLKQGGVKADGRYNDYDTLASKDDLTALYEVLQSFKGSDNRPPVITALSLVANPDFDKIKNDHFQKYHYEPFTKTLERYGQADAFELWQEGIKESLFIPQFHGREHLNVPVWLRALQKGDKQTLLGFGNGCWGFVVKNKFNINYQAAFHVENKEDIEIHKKVIEEGLQLFEQLHGYKATFFVPPNGPFNNQLEKIAAKGGIKYMSSAKIQKESLGEGKTKKRIHWLGQKNRHGQYYITRNAGFEPSAGGKDWMGSCLKEIEAAFRWNKPAVISSHRVNYIGGLDEKNRTESLKQLKELLTEITKRWPEARFVDSATLGDIVSGKG